MYQVIIKIELNCFSGKNCLKLLIYFTNLLLLSCLEYKWWPSFELNWISLPKNTSTSCKFWMNICHGSGEKIWKFSLCTLLYQQFRVNTRKFRGISWKLRVYSQKLRVHSRKFRVYSRKLRVYSRKFFFFSTKMSPIGV